MFMQISMLCCYMLSFIDKTVRVFKSIVIVINMVSIQNLLMQFCYILGKDTSWHFPLLGGLGKQF